MLAEAPAIIVTSFALGRTASGGSLSSPPTSCPREAQRIKTSRTRTASVVKRIQSRFAFVLTGTPLESRLDDLYSLMQVVDPHLFGPLSAPALLHHRFAAIIPRPERSVSLSVRSGE